MINIVLFVLLVFNYNVLDVITNKSSETVNKFSRRKTLASAIFANNSIAYTSNTTNRGENCRWLRGFKNQKNQCIKRRGFAEVLSKARKLATKECEKHFKYDKWNCSYNKDLFKKLYRETAFMQALATAAIMYTTARACSDAKLEKCPCATPEEQPNRPDWKWSGCGDNTKKAKQITRKFMVVKKPNDSFNEILKHNTEVGIKTVMEYDKKDCSCHGISASCVMKICFKRIQPFEHIAEKLKFRYHNAIKASARNTVKHSIAKKPQNKERLLYLANSPNFCPSTVGRRCLNDENCATMCCTRGYDPRTISVIKRCRFRYHDCCFNVTYDECTVKEQAYYCK